MIQFPPIPTWNAIHPLIVHFPIALLLIAPLFVVIGALQSKEKGRFFLLAALLLMMLGTTGTFVAQLTGDAAGKLAERTPQVSAVLERHEDLAETTSIAFSVLTVIFAALVLVPGFLRRAPNRITATVLPLAFLVLYSAGAVLLMNTAHNGGRLVHELGVRAVMPPDNAPITSRLHADADGD